MPSKYTPRSKAWRNRTNCGGEGEMGGEGEEKRRERRRGGGGGGRVEENGGGKGEEREMR